MMSSFKFLTVYLLEGPLLLLLLAAVCQADYYGDFATTPDYNSDDNFTFEYSFYSNSSSDELDKFFDTVGEGNEEVTTEVTEEVTTVTNWETTEKRSVNLPGAASLPAALELRTLVWTLTVLMVHSLLQL